MEWNAIPSDETIVRTAEALRQRSFHVFVVAKKTEALDKLKELIPTEASLMTGSSTALAQIGFTDYLVLRQHLYQDLKADILAEKDRQKQGELRRQAILADCCLGSAQAIAETGQVVNRDATGRRTGPYACGPRNVIWVAGVNKTMADLEQAVRRMWEHCVPLEDQLMKSLGAAGTTASRILVYERADPNRTTLVLAKERLGF